MKGKLCLLAVLAVVVAPAAFAAPSCTSAELAWLIDPAPEANVSFEPPEPVDLGVERQPGVFTRCSATANCGTKTISCSSGSGTCIGVDRNCPSQPGYVSCNGVVTQCQACACTNGTRTYTQLSSCCLNEDLNVCRRALREQTCINGNWVYTGIVCDGLNCTPGSCPL